MLFALRLFVLQALEYQNTVKYEAELAASTERVLQNTTRCGCVALYTCGIGSFKHKLCVCVLLPCSWIDAGKFLTGFSAVGSIAIPAILAHAQVRMNPCLCFLCVYARQGYAALSGCRCTCAYNSQQQGSTTSAACAHVTVDIAAPYGVLPLLRCGVGSGRQPGSPGTDVSDYIACDCTAGLNSTPLLQACRECSMQHPPPRKYYNSWLYVYAYFRHKTLNKQAHQTTLHGADHCCFDRSMRQHRQACRGAGFRPLHLCSV